MNNNGVVEKEEPKVCSQFIPLGIMIPAQEKPAEEIEEIQESGSTNGSRWFAATILIIVAWWIIYGWRLTQ